jgi:hypothetical protein
MRVGVELMMTNISVAKSSLRPSKMMHGHVDGRRVVGTLVQVEAQRRQAVLAVDDQVLGGGLAQAARAALAVAAKLRRSEVNSSTVPGIGGCEIAVS